MSPDLKKPHPAVHQHRFNEGAYHIVIPEDDAAVKARPTVERNDRVDWKKQVLPLYAILPVGHGVVINALLDYRRANLITQFQHYGLLVDVDYEVVAVKRDAGGAPLPKGHWIQYIRRLSPRVPSGG